MAEMKKDDYQECARARIEVLDRRISTLVFEKDLYKRALDPDVRRPLSPEMIEEFKGMYEKYKNTIESFLIKGSPEEKAEVGLIKDIAHGKIK